jgi:putative FmdB family regulatory protein
MEMETHRMPTYDYLCSKCKHRFEVFHSIRDDAPRRCPKCRARARRVPAGGGGLLFKGSGFYITDYRSDSYKKAAKQEKGDASPSVAQKKDAPPAKTPKDKGAPRSKD